MDPPLSYTRHKLALPASALQGVLHSIPAVQLAATKRLDASDHTLETG